MSTTVFIASTYCVMYMYSIAIYCAYKTKGFKKGYDFCLIGSGSGSGLVQERLFVVRCYDKNNDPGLVVKLD